MKFLIRQKIFSFGDNFTVKDEYGNPLLQVQGKIFSFGDQLKIYDMEGNELYYIEQKLFRLMPEYRIFEHGREVAFLKKEFTFFKPRIHIESDYGSYTIDGSFLGYNFTISDSNRVVASVDKEVFSFSDTYTLDVDNGQNMPFMVTLAIVIDQIIHDNNKNNH